MEKNGSVDEAWTQEHTRRAYSTTEGSKRGPQTSSEASRKPREKSRADEFRQSLMVWRETPAAHRPSLRELARELGTSHQLLKHYLDGLEEL